IRLLQIQPGSGHLDPISVKLAVYGLHDAPTYEALSYSWQDDAQDAITVNGVARFVLSKHLWHALRRLRSRNSERFIWIDAICINQKDEQEKSHQIPLMGAIYQQARRTIIWISE
ncbi:hypothetical protein BAUCODRAFT_55390, partial [Baudoinia panamericana UAMH 10762]